MIKDMIMNGIQTIAGFVKEKAIAVVGFLAKASFASVAKYAIGAGVAIGTVIMTLKFFRDKINMARSNENKTPVEKALDKNYSDYRKKKNLHPGMRKVAKTLFNDKKRRTSEKYGWVKDFVRDYEKKHGKMDPYAYNDPASSTWWDENIRFMYDDGRVDLDPIERADRFFDNFFNTDVDGYKSDDYDGHLRNVWDYGCLHGWSYEC